MFPLMSSSTTSPVILGYSLPISGSGYHLQGDDRHGTDITESWQRQNMLIQGKPFNSDRVVRILLKYLFFSFVNTKGLLIFPMVIGVKTSFLCHFPCRRMYMQHIPSRSMVA